MICWVLITEPNMAPSLIDDVIAAAANGHAWSPEGSWVPQTDSASSPATLLKRLLTPLSKSGGTTTLAEAAKRLIDAADDPQLQFVRDVLEGLLGLASIAENNRAPKSPQSLSVLVQFGERDHPSKNAVNFMESSTDSLPPPLLHRADTGKPSKAEPVNMKLLRRRSVMFSGSRKEDTTAELAQFKFPVHPGSSGDPSRSQSPSDPNLRTPRSSTPQQESLMNASKSASVAKAILLPNKQVMLMKSSMRLGASSRREDDSRDISLEDEVGGASTTHTYKAMKAQEACDAAMGVFTVNQYVLLQQIGRGAQGEVFHAMDMNSGAERAVKVVPRPARLTNNVSSLRQLQQLNREIQIMKTCRHRNVVSLFEIIDDPSHDELYLIMQLARNGALLKLNSRGEASKHFSIAEVAGYGRQLCSGLRYLHNKGIVHRDIKPENVLLGDDNTIYLSDFGISELLDMEEVMEQQATARRQSVALSSQLRAGGTMAFLAPELLNGPGNGIASRKAGDVWALGLTLYIMVYGHLPWRLDDMQQYMEDCASVDITFPEAPGTVAPTQSINVFSSDSSDHEAEQQPRAASEPSPLESCVSILRGMLDRDPLKRLTAGSAYTKFCDLCRKHAATTADVKTLRVDPNSITSMTALSNASMVGVSHIGTCCD